MDRSKNRTDLLAAGRKKLQQFRQKKDHKSSSSKTGGQAKSPKISDEHDQAEIPETNSHVSSSTTELNESMVEVNPSNQITTVEEHETERSPATITGVLLNPSSDVTSHQDHGTSEAEVRNERDEGNEIIPGADILAASSPGVMETNETDMLTLESTDECKISLNADLGTSERDVGNESMSGADIPSESSPGIMETDGENMLTTEITEPCKISLNVDLGISEPEVCSERVDVKKITPSVDILATSSPGVIEINEANILISETADACKISLNADPGTSETEVCYDRDEGNEIMSGIDIPVASGPGLIEANMMTSESTDAGKRSLNADPGASEAAISSERDECNKIMPSVNTPEASSAGVVETNDANMLTSESKTSLNADRGISEAEVCNERDEDNEIIPCADIPEASGAGIVETNEAKISTLESIDKCKISLDADLGTSEAEICNERDEDDEIMPRADIPLTSSPGVVETDEANMLNSYSTDVCKISLNADPITNPQLRTEILTEVASLSSQGHIFGGYNATYDVEENLVSQATLIPFDTTLCTSSSDHIVSREIDIHTEKELENASKDSVEAQTVEESSHGLPLSVSEEIIEFFQKESQLIQTEGEKFQNSVLISSQRNKALDLMENLRTHLYLTSVTKELLLQINECDFNLDDEISRLNSLVSMGDERNENLKKELEQCKFDLHAIHSSEKELEANFISARDEIYELHSELNQSRKDYAGITQELSDCKNLVESLLTENSKLLGQIIVEEDESRKLKAEKELSMIQIGELNDRINQLTVGMEDSRKDSEKLAPQLADCRFLVLSLQAENSRLASQKLSGSEEMNKIKDENDALVNENKRIADSLTDLMHQLSVAHQNTSQVEREYKETLATVEKLSEENLHLLNCLDIHQLKLKELTSIPYVDSSFVTRQASIEAEEILTKLEKALMGMYKHHFSLGKAGEKTASSGVSRLIQAFESKAHSSEEAFPIEGLSLADMDSFNLVKEEINNLRLILTDQNQDLAEERTTCQKQNDEVIVAEAEVESDAKNLKNHEDREAIDELVLKLAEFKETINNLQMRLDSTSENAEETSGRLLNQVESLQNEVLGMGESLLELCAMKDLILISAHKLDACIGLGLSGSLGPNSDLRISVDAAIELIDSLKDKLNAAYMDCDKVRISYDELSREYAGLREKDITFNGLLHRIYHSLLKYVINSPTIGELLQFPVEDFEILDAHLNDIFNRLDSDLASRNKAMEELKEQCNHLTDTVDELKSLLDRKNQDFDDLYKGCQELFHKLENWGINRSHGVTNPELHAHDSFDTLLGHLRDLVSLITQEHEEAMLQLNLAKNHLLEALFPSKSLKLSEPQPLHVIIERDVAPRISELFETEKRLNSLSFEVLEKDNMIQSLKDDLRKSDETLEISRSELDQSEKRLSSIREKLGIAVSKGKGLVVQRDSLKQSLIEVTEEFEKCRKEIQAKEEKLSLLEARLKSSEVDRIEALESELSYIRNSATQFRDYFLQKDSILQKIEETMEELDLPEDFHSKDTVEKVEWLAKHISGGDFLPSEESHADLNREYEELRSKFFTLTNQNEMLDQSLRERNNFVERLERTIDGIDMPHHIKSLEPKDRIEWLGRKLLEVELDRESLSSKIEHLDANLVNIGRENEVLSQNLARCELEKDSLLGEMSSLQEKLMAKMNEIDEVEIEMKKLLDSVSEALSDQAESSDTSLISYSPIHLGRLVENLVDSYKSLKLSLDKRADINHSYGDHTGGVFPGTKRPDKAQNDEVIHNLEVPGEERNAVNEYHFQTSEVVTLMRQRNELLEERERVEEKCQILSNELNSIMKQHDLLLQDRDSSVEKCQSLTSEFELVSKQRDLLLEERERSEEKCQSLTSEIESLTKHQDLLLEERDTTEEKYQSFTSEVEWMTKQMDLLQHERDSALEKHQHLSSQFDAVSKQREVLMEERDMAMEKYESLAIEFNLLIRQKDLLQEERDRAAQKYESLSSEFDSRTKQRDLLQQQLNTEEQKSASTKEKLTVAVRKGKSLVQHRDSLKKMLEEMTADFESTKKEFNQQLANVQWENRQLIDALNSIDLTDEASAVDPLQKIESIRKRIASADDADKSKRAAELLFAELNEVQERAETLQEELEMTKTKRNDALSHLEHLSMRYGEEKRMYVSSIMELKDAMSEMWNGLLGLSDALSSVMMKMVDRSSLGNLSHKPVSVLSSGDGFLESSVSEDDYNGLRVDYLRLAGSSLLKCTEFVAHLTEKILEHGATVDDYDKDISRTINDKEGKINLLQNNISTMFEACKKSALELEKFESSLRLPNCFREENHEERENIFDQDFAGVVVDSMLKLVKSFIDVQEEKKRELWREIQDKNSKIEEMINDKNYEVKIQSLMDNLAAKDQEIESLIQALDEEESQMEELHRKNQELEGIVFNNRASLESAESSRSKALIKLSKTLTRFEELHHLSENLLSEIESLQSQIQERDSEISFLRQEVARSTGDVMVKRETNKKLQNELDELKGWMDALVARLGGMNANIEGENPSRMKSTISYLNETVSEVNDLRLAGQTKDSLLEAEREKVSELTRKLQVLEASLQEREKSTSKSPDILELESVMNKRSTSGSVAPLARGGRRGNSEQVSVAIDIREDNISVEEEDDDKAHGFKSLTMSKIVPGAMRPVADRIDGLWVAIERLLMRQPSLRLGLILYWVLLHALLAASI